MILTATTVQGATPGTSSRDVVGDPVWTQGKAVRLTENQAKEKKWCTDCWVTVLLSVTKRGRYSILAKTNFGDAERVYKGKSIFGIGHFGENVCYKYHIQDAEKNLDVRFKQYSGVSSLTINPVSRPVDYTSAEFKDSGASDSVIRLTPAMRRSTSQGDRGAGLYYICMFAHTPASYAFYLQETEPGQEWERIENGFAHQHQIDSSSSVVKKQVFVYEVPKLEFATEDIDLNFVLEALSGPMPEMAVVYCNKFQTKGTKEEAMNLCALEVLKFSPEDIVRRSNSTNEVEFHWAK